MLCSAIISEVSDWQQGQSLTTIGRLWFDKDLDGIGGKKQGVDLEHLRVENLPSKSGDLSVDVDGVEFTHGIKVERGKNVNIAPKY